MSAVQGGCSHSASVVGFLSKMNLGHFVVVGKMNDDYLLKTRKMH